MTRARLAPSVLAVLIACSGAGTAQGPSSAKVDLHGDPMPEGAVARLGAARFRHSGRVNALIFSADGRLLLSAGDDGLRAWDTDSARAVKAPPLDWRLTYVAPTPDGRSLLFQEYVGPFGLLDIATGRRLRQFDRSSGMAAGFAIYPTAPPWPACAATTSPSTTWPPAARPGPGPATRAGWGR